MCVCQILNALLLYNIKWSYKKVNSYWIFYYYLLGISATEGGHLTFNLSGMIGEIGALWLQVNLSMEQI